MLNLNKQQIDEVIAHVERAAEGRDPEAMSVKEAAAKLKMDGTLDRLAPEMQNLLQDKNVEKIMIPDFRKALEKLMFFNDKQIKRRGAESMQITGGDTVELPRPPVENEGEETEEEEQA